MKRILATAVLAAISASALQAQAKPCVAMNDQNNIVMPLITLWASSPNTFAYRFVPSATVVALGMRICTYNKYKAGFGRLAVWSDDATKNSPKARIAEGTWKSPKATSAWWQGANFDGPVIMNKGTPYWFVWTETGWNYTPYSSGGTTLTTMVLRNNFWHPASASALKFRLYCSSLDQKNVTVFGLSCVSSASKRTSLFTNEAPSSGNANFRVEGCGFPAGVGATLLVGINKNFSSISLAPLIPGCFLNTDIVVPLPGTTGTGDVRAATAMGHISFNLPIIASIPRSAFFSTQLAVVDAKSSKPVKLVLTNALRTTIF